MIGMMLSVMTELIRVASLQRMKEMMNLVKEGMKFGGRRSSNKDGDDNSSNSNKSEDTVGNGNPNEPPGFSSLKKYSDMQVPELTNEHFHYALTKTSITCKCAHKY
jgi:hypothetical protein